MASAELKSDLCEAPEHSGLPGDSVLGAWRGRGTLTAGLAGAVDGGHPQVGGAGVKDDGEVLSGGADADGAEVLRLPGSGGVHRTHSSPTGDSPAWHPRGLSLGPLGHILPPPSLASLPLSLDPGHPSILQIPARSPFLLEVFPDCSPVNLCLFSSKPHEHPPNSLLSPVALNVLVLLC